MSDPGSNNQGERLRGRIKKMKAIKVTSSVGNEYGHAPGHQYHDVDVTIIRTRRGKWTVEILETSGNAQGYDEEHGRKQVIGRGDELSAAITDARERAERACIDNDNMGYLERAISGAESEAISEAEAADAKEVPSGSLAELHVAGQTNYRVITDGAGLSFLEVGAGDNIGGYKDKILKLCTVATWQPFERGGKQYIPTYAYDRLVVAGLGCLVEAE